MKLRSVLYMPAANARALEKATTIPCDALILDLEDAVAPEAKDLARAQAADAVRAGGYAPRVVVVRCNGLDTPWGAADIAAMAQTGADALLVPKIASIDDVADFTEALREAAAPPSMRMWVMIETPAAVLSARDIAAAPMVDVLVMGTNDLLLELRATPTAGRATLIPHLALSLAGARASGVRILDGVFNDIADPGGFEEECRQGADLGFDGKTLIHPSQVDACNGAWSPSGADIARARHIVDAFAAATRQGHGVTTVEGQMIESLHVEMARRVLDLAD